MINFIKHNFYSQLLLSLCLGVAFNLSFTPFYFWWLGIAILSIFLLLISSQISYKRVFLLSLAFFFSFFFIALHWLVFAILVFVEDFWWFIPFVLFIGPLLVTSLYVIVCMLVQAVATQQVTKILLLAVLLPLTDWLRGHFFLNGFPWLLFGDVFVGNHHLAQIASYVGVYGLSLLMLILASLGTLFLVGRKENKIMYMSLFFFILLFAITLGYSKDKIYESAQDSTVNIRVVQANIPQKSKWNLHQATQAIRKYAQLTLKDIPDSIQTIIWPESAIVFAPAQIRDTIKQLLSNISQQTTLISGINRRDQDNNLYNSLMVFDRQGKTIVTYDKSHLVPFGEYIPFSGVLEKLGMSKISAGQQNFSSGPPKQVMNIAGIPPFSPLICYESIFPAEVVSSEGGVKWMLNIVNDGWFGNSIGPFQHLAQARLRTIEEGIPMVRAANTGISAVIDAEGKIIQRLPLSTSGVMDFALPLPLSQPTLYAKWHDIPFFVMTFLLFCLTLVVCRIQSRHPKQEIEQE